MIYQPRNVQPSGSSIDGNINNTFTMEVQTNSYISAYQLLIVDFNNNNIYTTWGFKLTSISKPDYRYVIGNKRIHKFNCRKNILHKKYGFPLTMTEQEMVEKLGYRKIWDCGLIKYTFYKKN